MKVSFDGMRKRATENMNNLHEVLKDVIELVHYESISDDLKMRIIETFNNSAQSVDSMNCLYDDNIKDDMNDLSDILSINTLDELEEDEDQPMTREEAKSDVVFYGMHSPQQRDKFLEQLIDKIYNDHEAQLKAKDDEIERLKAEVENLNTEIEYYEQFSETIASAKG